jgi:hypothetical protein
MIEVLEKRLHSWGNRFLSFGGRIVLLNSVLSAIPIFYLSFMKMPVRVWKEVVKIQRTFLWSGLEKKLKICWVNWDTVTTPKIDGGLGVRDLRRVNLSLLAKWRWRFLNNDRSCWKLVLEAKYGNNLAHVHLQQEHCQSRTASLWWKDVCKLEGDGSWFAEAAVKKVGDGNTTLLWTDYWLGNFSLKNRFPRLFGISTLKLAKVAEAGYWANDCWHWSLEWRRNLFVWEEDLLRDLMATLQGAALSSRADRWVWSEAADGVFTVNSCYNVLTRHVASVLNFSEFQKLVFQNIWRSAAPLKVTAFSWQVLHDKFPTRRNLHRRGVIVDPAATGCIFCGAGSETAVHLFLHCKLASGVWYKVCRWLGFHFVNPPSLFISFASFLGFTSSKKRKKGLSLIWHAVLWAIWKARNDLIFNNKSITEEEVVDLVIVSAWRWFLGRLTKHPCLLYEWKHELFCCLDA